MCVVVRNWTTPGASGKLIRWAYQNLDHEMKFHSIAWESICRRRRSNKARGKEPLRARI